MFSNTIEIDMKVVHDLRRQKMSYKNIGKKIGVDDSTLHVRYKKWLEQKSTRDMEGFQSGLSCDDWAVKYCGPEYSWRLKYLTGLRKKLKESLKCLGFLPRGSGKSNVCISSNCQFILETYQPVLILTSGVDATNVIYNEMRRIFQSEVVKEDYGGEIFVNFNNNLKTVQLRPDLRKSKYPVLRVASRHATIIGSHPKRLWIEDIIQEPFKSDESNKSLMNWFSSVVEYCCTFEPGKETQLLGTGTRKGVKDFYSYLIDKLYYPVYRLPAIELKSGRYPENKDIIRKRGHPPKVPMNLGKYKTLGCPNLPLETLLLKRATNIYDFSTNMQNEPISISGLFFNKDDLKEVKFSPTREHKFIIAVDPAVGESARSDNTAICVIANNPHLPGFYTIVEMFASQITNIRKPLLAAYLKWNNIGRVIKIVCEADYWQKALIVDKLQETFPFHISPSYSQQSKVARIQGLKTPISKQTLTVWEDAEGKDDFIDEYLDFIPAKSTATRHDDQLDAVQMGFEAWLHQEGEELGVSFRTSSMFETAALIDERAHMKLLIN